MNVESTRLQAIEEIFHAAVDLPVADLGAFLDERCAGNESLRREVEALLSSHRAAGHFIESPVASFDSSAFDAAEPPDALIGETLGHYEITKRIGSGGMGAVYLARRADRQYEKLVAIKLIKRGMDTETVLRHFRNERQILAGFEHPNIARLIDGDTTAAGLPYFVMEYVEGVPIDEYCDRERLGVTERLQLFQQVCAALSYAHRRAVIHRDIKPSNILVGTDGIPKLLDFGIAKILESEEGEQPAATILGQRVMTPEYASPEQLRGDAVTTLSDVYSLGVVLYRLLTGSLPGRVTRRSGDGMPSIDFTEVQRPSAVIAASTAARGDSDAQSRTVARRPAEGSVERLQRRLRGDLDNIVLMALRSAQERRYQSVEQFSEDIRRHLELLPVVARADTLAYRAAKFVRRNSATTAAAALVVLTLLGGIVATSWQAHRARTQEALARAEKARAERRFNEVRQLAHSVLFDYHDAIKDLPGATAVRERLVRDGLEYLDSLAGEVSDDRALQAELAAAYERVGDVRGEAYGANLGDPAGAIESYEKALRIRESLVKADPHNVRARSDLARSHMRIGNRLIATGESARGLEHLRRSLAVYQQLDREGEVSAELRNETAAAYSYLGLAFEDLGDAPGALDNQLKALVLRTQLATDHPANPEYRRNLAVAHINVGRALVLSGNVKEGVESNQKALVMCQALHAENSESADYRRLLANTYQNDGDYRAILGDTAGALASFRRKLVLDEQALADDPVDARSRSDVGYTGERIGVLLTHASEPAQALPFYHQALAMLEVLTKDAPEDLSLRYHASVTRAGLAEALGRLGDRGLALTEASRAIQVLEATPEEPTNSTQSSLRGQVYLHVGDAHAALARSTRLGTTERRGHWHSARDMYARSLAIWQDMQQRGILTGEDAARPGQLAREVARCDASLHTPARATPADQSPRRQRGLGAVSRRDRAIASGDREIHIRRVLRGQGRVFSTTVSGSMSRRRGRRSCASWLGIRCCSVRSTGRQRDGLHDSG
jgi:serine/threonine protein kinase